MIRVVGLGEPARGDDGVGHAVAAAVRARSGLAVTLARDATALVDALLDADRVVLVDALLDADRVVLVDAVLAAAPAGTVLRLAEDALVGDVHPVSTHAASVPAAVALARALGATARLDVVGVVVDGDTALRDGLSAAVRGAVPSAVDAVLGLVARRLQGDADGGR